MQEIVDGLRNMGFTEYEARAYLALVRLGKSTAREIGETAKIPPGRIYTVLNILAARGFVHVLEGSPATYHAEDPAGIFDAIRDEYCESVNALVRQLEGQRNARDLPSPFWTISSERGIQILLKAAVRNARKEIIIMAFDPRHLLPVVPALKTAAKRINLDILAGDKPAFAGLGLKVRGMGSNLIALLEEMHTAGTVMEYDRMHEECFFLIDANVAVSIGNYAGKRNATVIRMPTLCFMMRKLIGIAEPEIGPFEPLKPVGPERVSG